MAAPEKPRDTARDELVRAIDDNTEALHALRVALCGTGRDPKPGGAIGSAADDITRGRGTY